MNLGIACPTDFCPVSCFVSSAVLVKSEEQYVQVCFRQDVKCELSVWLKIGKFSARADLGSGIRRIQRQDETAKPSEASEQPHLESDPPLSSTTNVDCESVRYTDMLCDLSRTHSAPKKQGPSTIRIAAVDCGKPQNHVDDAPALCTTYATCTRQDQLTEYKTVGDVSFDMITCCR